MLVLSRRKNQVVIVGDDVKVTLLDVRIGEVTVVGSQVKLGFQAPKEVSIQRQEVFDRMKSKGSSGIYRPKPEIAGKIQPVHDAAVRLEIQAPPETPIYCSRPSGNSSGHRHIVPPCQTESISADQDHPLGLAPIRVINCQKEDNILIGNQLLITIVDVFRFVIDTAPSRSGPAALAENSDRKPSKSGM